MSLIKRTRNILDDWMEMPFTRYLQTNVREKKDKYVLEISIPGFQKEDLKLSLDNGYLTFEAEKKQEIDDTNDHYIRRERRYGKFQRSFYVGDVSLDQIEAKYKNGILYVEVPKDKKDETKLIEIK